MIEHKFSGKIDNIGEKNHYIYFHQLWKIGYWICKPKDKISVA